MSPDINVGFRDSVRLALRAEYDSQGHQGGFRSLGASWGVSSGVAHSLYSKDNYWPSERGIRLAIEAAARSRGILVRRRGPKPDLWSLGPGVLLWKLANRIECKGDQEFKSPLVDR